jgi:hypothetical protein
MYVCGWLGSMCWLVIWYVLDAIVSIIAIALISSPNTHASVRIPCRTARWSLNDGVASMPMRVTEPVLAFDVDTSAASPTVFRAKWNSDARISNTITTEPLVREGVVHESRVGATPEPFAHGGTGAHVTIDRSRVNKTTESRLDLCVAPYMWGV